nr:unnamed protein product [Callosobruchus analis]
MLFQLPQNCRQYYIFWLLETACEAYNIFIEYERQACQVYSDLDIPDEAETAIKFKNSCIQIVLDAFH